MSKSAKTPHREGAPPRTAYTLREVAESTGLSLRQIQRLAKKGDLTAKLLGGCRVVMADDFAEFLRSAKEAS